MTTNIVELLRDDEPAIVDEATPTIAQLEHYRRDGADATRRRVETLCRQVARAVRARDLDGLLAYAARIASERFSAGFDHAEVDAAIAALQDAISRRALAALPADAELAWGLGLVGTAIAHARAELGRAFVSLTGAGRPGALDLTSVFRRTERCGRSAEELVHPV